MKSYSILNPALSIAMLASGWLAGIALAADAPTAIAAQPQVNALLDCSHAYSFVRIANREYHKQIFSALPKAATYSSMRALGALDLTDINLLVVPVDTDLPYGDKDGAHLREFVEKDGGGILFVPHRIEPTSRNHPSIATLTKSFGFAWTPLQGKSSPALRPSGKAPQIAAADLIPGGAAMRVQIAEPADWTPLWQDAAGTPVVVMRKIGKGCVVVCGMEIMQLKRDATRHYSCPNRDALKPLWTAMTAGRAVGNIAGPTSGGFGPAQPRFAPELTLENDALKIVYNAYQSDIVKDLETSFNTALPLMEAMTGQSLEQKKSDWGNKADKMTIICLSCGGSGYSSGRTVGMGIYKPGDDPNRFLGLYGHELTHSWVSPWADPLGNEPIAHYGCAVVQDAFTHQGIATYLGGRAKGIVTAPGFLDYDILDPTKTPGAKGCGDKYVPILARIGEVLGPKAIRNYFRLRSATLKGCHYSAHDCVFLWGIATGQDLFPFFNSIHISASRDKVAVARAAELPYDPVAAAKLLGIELEAVPAVKLTWETPACAR